MVFRYLNRPRGGSTSAYDADVILWWQAVIANGGSVSATRLGIVNTFVVSEKNAGLWSLTDDYWGFWAENSVQALTSLKQRRLATAVNSPTFTADRDYATNGTTSYINLNFVPSTHALSMSTNSVHAEIYERANVAGNTVAMGATSNSYRSIALGPRRSNGTDAICDGNSAGATYTLPAATSVGLTQSGRNGSLTTDAYGAKDGADMPRTVTPSGVGASLPAQALLVGAFNNNGTPAILRASSYGYAACGAALDSTQRAARFVNVDAWRSAVGA